MNGLLEVLGGAGLFILGMNVMSDGLNRLAGETMRRTIGSFTRTPLTGTLTGTVVTALIQSSGATVVMAIGFVGAGLLTFPQALGVIFGANIGTTFTGWIVALLGFTLDLKLIAMPLLFIGALMRLIKNQKITAIGYAISGFAAIFIGIAMLQSGMEAYRDILTPKNFPEDTLSGRFLLLLLGVAITLITQSSSAGVAAAITAVHVGNISLPQAAAMVIGMDIGTTNIALIASIGSNVNARRTGLSHVIYNLFTGLGSFFFLPFYLQLAEYLFPNSGTNSPELVLVAFHTLFNTLGVLLVLPFTQPFAKLIIWFIPPRKNPLTERLEPSLLKNPPVAMENVLRALREISQALFVTLVELLAKNRDNVAGSWSKIDDVESAIGDVRLYLNQINDPIAVQKGFQQKVKAVHILDHLSRLVVRVRKHDRLESAWSKAEYREFVGRLRSALEMTGGEDSQDLLNSHRELTLLSAQLHQQNNFLRREQIERGIVDLASVDELTQRLDALRWLQRVAYHALRITHHLTTPGGDPSNEMMDQDDDDHDAITH
ncbi:MAG: Na/Pi symporter [Pirellulaceae bacterium]